MAGSFLGEAGEEEGDGEGEEDTAVGEGVSGSFLPVEATGILLEIVWEIELAIELGVVIFLLALTVEAPLTPEGMDIVFCFKWSSAFSILMEGMGYLF